MKQFEDSLINSWIAELQINDKEQSILKIHKIVNLHAERFSNTKMSQTELFFTFYENYLQLILITSRKYLIQILTYLNFFRNIQ